MQQPAGLPAPYRFLPVSIASLLLCACAVACPPAVEAQLVGGDFRTTVHGVGRTAPDNHDRIDADGPRGAPPALLLGPYVSLPLSDAEIQPAVGAHVEWAVTEQLGLAARYEWRIAESEWGHACASLDAVQNLAGTDTLALALTAGWARWRGQDRGTVGVRFRGPMVTTASGGGALIELWIDVRDAFPSVHDLARFSGRLWAAVMFVLPLNAVIRH